MDSDNDALALLLLALLRDGEPHTAEELAEAVRRWRMVVADEG